MRLITPTVLLVFVSTFTISGQHYLTIGEVYDYDIGDEFQFSRIWGEQGPPNAHRYIVIDKQFSSNQDTIIYTMHYTGYSPSYYDDQTNRWVNTFYDTTVTEEYTNLDQPLHPVADSINDVDSIVYYYDFLCNDSIYGYNYRGGGFINVYYEYGKGIGRTYYHEPGIEGFTFRLFYFKKGDRECGEKDVLGIEEPGSQHGDVSVYPNPASEHIWIDSQNEPIDHLILLDMNGRVLLKQTVHKIKYRLNLDSYESGIYILNVITDKGSQRFKILVN